MTTCNYCGGTPDQTDDWPEAQCQMSTHYVDDLEVAINRLRHVTHDDRIHHPATPTEIRRCLDDLADTVERMWA